MTDITELAQSMKAAAKKATPGPWALARDRKTVVSNQSHPIANLSDAMHRMLADGTTGQDAEFISLANPANILSLVEALEKAQQRIDSQREYYEGVIADGGKRIADLESRTVKLPEPEQWDITQVLLCKKKVVAAIRAAGIKVEDE
ncbi:ead/Ea22-like family protein [Klebsiella pneumoniae]